MHGGLRKNTRLSSHAVAKIPREPTPTGKNQLLHSAADRAIRTKVYNYGRQPRPPKKIRRWRRVHQSFSSNHPRNAPRSSQPHPRPLRAAAPTTSLHPSPRRFSEPVVATFHPPTTLSSAPSTPLHGEVQRTQTEWERVSLPRTRVRRRLRRFSRCKKQQRSDGERGWRKASA